MITEMRKFFYSAGARNAANSGDKPRQASALISGSFSIGRSPNTHILADSEREFSLTAHKRYLDGSGKAQCTSESGPERQARIGFGDGWLDCRSASRRIGPFARPTLCERVLSKVGAQRRLSPKFLMSLETTI